LERTRLVAGELLFAHISLGFTSYQWYPNVMRTKSIGYRKLAEFRRSSFVQVVDPTGFSRTWSD
jgi:hypothetical protein